MEMETTATPAKVADEGSSDPAFAALAPPFAQAVQAQEKYLRLRGAPTLHTTVEKNLILKRKHGILDVQSFPQLKVTKQQE